MGGDHKCPVCQATFTRPQHVARHMRSHTGDRPYKCQHCGDQFARSDLLSRHINKCHPSEAKSHPSTSSLHSGHGGGRRKGASATRATTSKQACDQCVQSSLPCDGANPCSKCVLRKMRCTFVKFHRQTMPVGPGHSASTATTTGGTAGTQGYAQQQPPAGAVPAGHGRDEFLLSHPPQPHPASSSASSTAAADLFPPTTYSYHPDPLAGFGSSPTAWNPPPPQQYAGGSSSYPAPPPTTNALVDQLFGGRFEIPLDPHHHGGVQMQQHQRHGHGRTSSNSTSASSIGSSGIEGDFSRPSTSSSSSLSHSSHQHAQHTRGEGGFSSAFGLLSLEDPNVLAGLSEGVPFFTGSHPDFGSERGHPDFSSSSAGAGGASEFTSSTSDFADEFAFNPPSHSDGEGASAGGGLHFSPLPPLTLPPQSQSQQQQYPSRTDFRSSSNPLNDFHLHLRRPATASRVPSGSWQSFTGGAKELVGGGSGSDVTPSATREMETRELREFWKAYLRTPPTSGGTPLGGTTGTAQQGGGGGGGNGGASLFTPDVSTPRGGRARTNSLPSVITPPLYGGPSGAYMSTHHTNLNPPPPPRQSQQSNVRATLHGPAEDLRSYEAAVLARAPTTMELNLVPKARRKQQTLPPIPPPSITDRPGSSSSSSLANAFGPPPTSKQRAHRKGHSSDSPSSSGSGYSRESSLSLEEVREQAKRDVELASLALSRSAPGPGLDPSTGIGVGMDHRPTYKRLPSQILGPDSAKRTRRRPGVGEGQGQLHAAGWGEEEWEESSGSSNEMGVAGSGGRM